MSHSAIKTSRYSLYLFRVIEGSIEVALDPAWHRQLIKMIFSDNFDNDVSEEIKCVNISNQDNERGLTCINAADFRHA